MKSFWCVIGLHDWKWIWDDSSRKAKEITYPMYEGYINRACLRCEKLDMRADRYLAHRKQRKNRLEQILEKKNDD